MSPDRRDSDTERDETIAFVLEVQSAMIEAAGEDLTRGMIDPLRCLVRITIEFHECLRETNLERVERESHVEFDTETEYVEHIRKLTEEIESSLKCLKERDSVECAQILKRLKSDLRYNMETVFSGVDSFMLLCGSYGTLPSAVPSRLDWGNVSIPRLKERFEAHFAEFLGEEKFEEKCRLLLDLFKIQVVLAGMIYDRP